MNSLSILIPVFNWDCSRFLTDLHRQGCRLGVPFEIVVADDCSNVKYGNEQTAGMLENCRFIGLDRNVGRARIRNILADESRFEKLLFLDCDLEVKDDSFLKNYLEASEKADVVCGGVRTPDEMPGGMELRFLYEQRADRSRTAELCNRQPYARFTTSTFMIGRDDFMKIRFDESYGGYGYEDVQFGVELERRGMFILHIDNPLVHLGLEPNAVYLEKTENAVRNAFEHREKIGSGSTLLNHFGRLERFRMVWAGRLAYRMFAGSMRRNLVGNKPSLKVFSLYKLCYLCHIKG